MRDVDAGTRNAQQRTLIKANDILPSTLQKEDEWRTWRSDVEDYCEESFSGMKEILSKVRKMSEVVSAENLPEAGKWWSYGDSLWRFLKKYTHVFSESRSIVNSVGEDNGWEAWRKLQAYHEPCQNHP